MLSLSSISPCEVDLGGTPGRSVLLQIGGVVAALVTLILVLNGTAFWMHSAPNALQSPRYIVPLRTRQDTPVAICSCTGHVPAHALFVTEPYFSDLDWMLQMCSPDPPQHSPQVAVMAQFTMAPYLTENVREIGRLRQRRRALFAAKDFFHAGGSPVIYRLRC